MDVDRAWRVHAQVAVRAETFGALLYHFGTRRLSFVKDPVLAAVVQGLDDVASPLAACTAAGVPPADIDRYLAALRTLADTRMIEERDA